MEITMVSKITFLTLFGIIIFTNGKPAYTRSSNHEGPLYDIKTLIEELSKQGKYDIILNHHEDQPGNHHEDITQLTFNGGKSNSHQYDAPKYHAAESYKVQSSLDKPLHYGYHPKYLRTAETNNDKTKDLDHVDEVTTFLEELDQKLKLNGRNDLELRCYGDRCGASRDEASKNNKDEYLYANREYNQKINNYDSHLRCNGMRCSVNEDNDRNDRDGLRCYGNRCSRKANDNNANDGYDNIDISKVLRCAGENCGINRDDDYNDRHGLDTLRCIGDRCGASRAAADGDDGFNEDVYYLQCNDKSCNMLTNDGDYTNVENLRCKKNCMSEDYGITSLRCRGNQCSRISEDDDDDNDNSMYTVRCAGKSCSIYRDDDDDDDDDDARDNLRCNGKSCSRNRNDDDDDGLDNLHCNGKSCSINRDDDDDGKDHLRCNGRSCSRNRNGDYTVIIDNDRYDDANERNNDRYDRKDDRYDGYTLRCIGDRCGVNRDDDDSGNLRCIGDRCGRSGVSAKVPDSKLKSRETMRALLDKLLKLRSPDRK